MFSPPWRGSFCRGLRNIGEARCEVPHLSTIHYAPICGWAEGNSLQGVEVMYFRSTKAIQTQFKNGKIPETGDYTELPQISFAGRPEPKANPWL